MDHISYLAHFHSLFNGLIKMTSPAVISKLENSSLMHRLEGNSKWPVLTLRPTCKNRNKHSDTNQKWIETMSKLKQLSMICLHILKIPDMFSCCKKFMTCRRTLELYEHQWLGHFFVITSDQRHIFKYLFILASLLKGLRGKTRDSLINLVIYQVWMSLPRSWFKVEWDSPNCPISILWT